MKLHVAIVVQEGMKEHLQKLINTHKLFLSDTHTVSTKGTAEYLYHELGFKVTNIVHSGDRGGDIKIANKIIDGEIDILIFLLNPMQNFPHSDDVKTLIRSCNVKDIPLALNTITADMLLSRISC